MGLLSAYSRASACRRHRPRLHGYAPL